MEMQDNYPILEKCFILAENRLDVENAIIILKFSAVVQYMFCFICEYQFEVTYLVIFKKKSIYDIIFLAIY